MQMSKWWICTSFLITILVVRVFAGSKEGSENKASSAVATAPSAGAANVTALLGMLVMKGVLAPGEANAIRNAAPDAEFQMLVEVLKQKGVLSAADVTASADTSAARATSSPAPAAPAAAASATPVSALVVQAQAQTVAPTQIKPPAPTVASAVTPLRVLPLDPPVREGLVPAFKIGPIKVTPYGFIKATAIHDSSNPNGDDFPFPGIWLNSSSVLSTGPTRDPSFHIKARASRFGYNFEWLDLSPKLTLTGRVEGDFEGGFTEVDNADVSSIRNPQPRLRLAYVRMDYAATESSDLFFEGGQNWSLFGSTALPNILETTFLGAFSGDIWERTPQFRFGMIQKLGTSDRDFKFSPEIALMMPSTGEIMKLNTVNPVGGFEAQIGEGERQGADSGRPELEARAVLQFKLDKAPAVAPAQLIWSGYEGRRTAITTSGNISGPDAANILSQYPKGFTASSNMFGNQLAVQLPTRWFTVVASGYRGADMRFMLAGQLNTFFTDTTGLYNVQAVQTVDNVNLASGGMMVGCSKAIAPGSTCTASGGTWQIARQRPIGAFGGFINLGLPLSRWAHADPKGHNAGWQLYLNAGKDQVVHHDLARANGFGCASADGATACNGGLPLSQSRMLAATLYYKLNNWATFAFEQSQYQTTLLPEVGAAYSIAGTPATKWKDQRTEFGPIFTF